MAVGTGLSGKSRGHEQLTLCACPSSPDSDGAFVSLDAERTLSVSDNDGNTIWYKKLSWTLAAS